jgi:hypothetical protein
LLPAINTYRLLTEILSVDLLQKASATSDRANLAIFKWETRRVALMRARRVPFAVTVYVARERSQEDLEAELGSLTIQDVRTLAGEPPITVEQYEAMIERYERIGLPGFSFGLAYMTAIHVTHAVITLALVWFWLHEREARARSPKFPSPGTIFGVFAQSRTTHALFYVLLSAPASASILMAVAILGAQTNVQWWEAAVVCSLAALTVTASVGIGWDLFRLRRVHQVQVSPPVPQFE